MSWKFANWRTSPPDWKSTGTTMWELTYSPSSDLLRPKSLQACSSKSYLVHPRAQKHNPDPPKPDQEVMMLEVDRLADEHYGLHSHQNIAGKQNRSRKNCLKKQRLCFNLVSSMLYQRGSHSEVLMKSISREEGKSFLEKIHARACRNHTTSRTLVGKAFRSRFYWPTILVAGESLVRYASNANSLANR